MSNETATDRITRIAPDVNEKRRESLILAAELGTDDETLATLARATRLSRENTIVIPAHRYEGLSRGRGWCRSGRGKDATWGERTDGGYRVGPGRWSVGGTDGFARKGEVVWDVARVQVGDQTWTIAN